MLRPARSNDTKRKVVEFRSEIWQALFLLARDSGKNLEALANEAFTDLLRKYRRPLSLKEALRESARRLPANDDVPPERNGTLSKFIAETFLVGRVQQTWAEATVDLDG